MGTLSVLFQEHNTVSPARARYRTARSGDERTNYTHQIHLTRIGHQLITNLRLVCITVRRIISQRRNIRLPW